MNTPNIATARSCTAAHVNPTEPFELPSDCHSVFVDAGHFNNGKIGWGFVINNSNGGYAVASCRREELSIEPLVAEAIGIRW